MVPLRSNRKITKTGVLRREVRRQKEAMLGRKNVREWGCQRCVRERVCQRDDECDRKSLGIGTHGTWLQSSLLTYVL